MCGLGVRDNLGLAPTSRPKDHYTWLLTSQTSLSTLYSSALLGHILTLGPRLILSCRTDITPGTLGRIFYYLLAEILDSWEPIIWGCCFIFAEHVFDKPKASWRRER